MAVITIDTEMAEALMEIKSKVPQINAQELKTIVFSYYEEEPEFEIIEVPPSLQKKMDKLGETIRSPKVQKMIQEKLKKQKA